MFPELSIRISAALREKLQGQSCFWTAAAFFLSGFFSPQGNVCQFKKTAEV